MNRGILKDEKLKDSQGSLADYNQAIILNPQFAVAYNNRGFLKNDKLNDKKGSLADYNQAIILNPQYALAYANRAYLKYKKLDDRSGGIADIRKAADLAKAQENIALSNFAIKTMQKWGVSY
jgi:tetratricopeptide (TPR) repeat protein